MWIFLSLEKGKLFCNDSSGFPEALASGLHGPRSPLPSPGPGRGLRAGRRCSERKAHIHTLGTSLAITPANSNVPALPCEADKTNAGTLSGWGGLTSPSSHNVLFQQHSSHFPFPFRESIPTIKTETITTYHVICLVSHF